jgi:hypothetical protein
MGIGVFIAPTFLYWEALSALGATITSISLPQTLVTESDGSAGVHRSSLG